MAKSDYNKPARAGWTKAFSDAWDKLEKKKPKVATTSEDILRYKWKCGEMPGVTEEELEEMIKQQEE